ncbi:MAG: hypothetical protein ABEI86_06540, partial [Halobacteriaceae archaeon]
MAYTMGAVSFCEVKDYEVRSNQLYLRCSVETIQENAKPEIDEKVSLIFTFYSESILNIFFSPLTDRSEYAPALDLDYESIQSSVELSENTEQGVLEVSNGTLTVRVELESADFSISGEKELLRNPQTLTDTRGRLLSKPLGFSEKEVQNW